MTDDGIDEEDMPALDEIISIPRAARLLGSDPSRLTRRAQAGRFPATKVGGIWLTSLRRIVEAEKAGETKARFGPPPRPLPAKIQQLIDAAPLPEVTPDA